MVRVHPVSSLLLSPDLINIYLHDLIYTCMSLYLCLVALLYYNTLFSQVPQYTPNCNNIVIIEI